MHKSQTKKTTVFFQSQPFRELQSVHIAVPCIDFSLRQVFGDLQRRAIGSSDRHRWHALAEPFALSDAPDAEARPRTNSVQQALGQFPFVILDGLKGNYQALPP